MGLQKLGLGTVQWGVPYGVSNASGQTPPQEVADILGQARQHGLTVLDTACQYGESEAVLGRAGVQGFRVVSKTPRLSGITSQGQAIAEIRQAIRATLARLGCESLYGYLVHQADDLQGLRGTWVARALHEIKSEGLVQNVGVSVYDAAQLESARACFRPDLVQLPLNVLDQRMLQNGSLDSLQHDGTEVHVRSVFLQGLLVMPLSSVPAYFEPIRSTLSAWHERVAVVNQSPLAAALAFVRDLPQVSTLVVGVENATQYGEIARAMQTGQCPGVADLSCSQEAFINPAKWILQ